MYFKQPLGTLGVKPVGGERTISGLDDYSLDEVLDLPYT
jgi:hypothetical protein